MKGESLLAKISVLAAVFAFSSCQKIPTDSLNVSPSPFVSSMPSSDSAIRNVDFANFTYPWTDEMISPDEKTFTLKNGEKEFVMNRQTGVSLAKTEYGDVTGDGAEEALISLSVRTGGSYVPNMIYVYAPENGTPKLLWSFNTGDRAQGGFKKVYADNKEFVVELFGLSKFENGKWSYEIPAEKFQGDCCPTVYTKSRFKWNGEKFVVNGTPEVFDYDWKNQ